MMVPMVPMLETKWVILPWFCCQMSGPVERNVRQGYPVIELFQYLAFTFLLHL